MAPDPRRPRCWPLVALPLLVAACAERAPSVPAPATALRPLASGAVPPLLDRGAPGSLRRAVEESLAWLEAQPPGRTFAFGPVSRTAVEQRTSLRGLLSLLADDPPPDVLWERVRERFDVLVSVGGADGSVLVTGYYEPVIEASLAPAPGYDVAVYGPPGDRVEVELGDFAERWRGDGLVGRLDAGRLVPYWDRREIRAGRLAGRGLEIAWARDEVDLFFLEVQGGGLLRLPDGSERTVGYAGSNGRPYRSVGKLLADEGRIPRERLSMQSVRAYLARHPEERARVLAYNPSFVFFRLSEGGAKGSLGRPLTAGRSIATDGRLFPQGALAFLETSWPEVRPDGTVGEGGALVRFVLNQDTGGAIRGADRVDLFLGRGARAGASAGALRHRGRLYFLLGKAGG